MRHPASSSCHTADGCTLLFQVLFLRENNNGSAMDSLAASEREVELTAEKERLGRQAKELAKQLALRIKERDERGAELVRGSQSFAG